jgi:hypothetical protein
VPAFNGLTRVEFRIRSWIECQTACKPGSVRTRRCGTAIPLGRVLRRASRDQPGRRSGDALAPCGTAVPIRSCSRWGLPCRPCRQGRGALLPHRFALARGLPCGACAGGVFSVALSLGSPPPAVSRHRIPVEPGLSSIALRRQRPSGRLAATAMDAIAHPRQAEESSGRCGQGTPAHLSSRRHWRTDQPQQAGKPRTGAGIRLSGDSLGTPMTLERSQHDP